MNNWVAFNKKLEENISQLSDEKKIEFAITICDRLYPEYEKFQAKHEWGDSEIVSKCLNFCKKKSNLKEIDQNQVEELINEIDLVIPNTEDFGDLAGSFALNAGTSVYYTLKFLQNKKDENILRIAQNMYDTIDFIVQEENENITEEELENHPKIVEEIKWQLEKSKNIG